MFDDSILIKIRIKIISCISTNNRSLNLKENVESRFNSFSNLQATDRNKNTNILSDSLNVTILTT